MRSTREKPPIGGNVIGIVKGIARGKFLVNVKGNANWPGGPQDSEQPLEAQRKQTDG